MVQGRKYSTARSPATWVDTWASSVALLQSSKRKMGWQPPYSQTSESLEGQSVGAGIFYPNTMTTLCLDAMRAVATKKSDWPHNLLIPCLISQGVAKHRNVSKLLILSVLTIRNQQVAGSIPAGGSSIDHFSAFRRSFNSSIN